MLTTVVIALSLLLINVCRGDELLGLFCVNAEHCEKFRHADITVACVEHHCRCSTGDDDDECPSVLHTKDPAPGDYCRSQADCYQRQLPESEQTMECLFGECFCKPGYISIDNGECFRSSGGAGRPPKLCFVPLGAAVALSVLRCRFL